MMDLTELGFDSFFREEFERKAGAGEQPGRVVLEHRDRYILLTASGELSATVSGRLRHESFNRSEGVLFPAVGDWVCAKVSEDGGIALITEVLTRKSRFSRKVAGVKTEEQVLAANIDFIFWVTSPNRDFNKRRVERFLFSAAESGAKPVIIINKADLSENPGEMEKLMKEVAGDTPVHAVSAHSGLNIQIFDTYLAKGITAVFLGTSGVGKSSIINRLEGKETLVTGEIRKYDDKGRHTTTVRHLMTLSSGGMVIDTPGIRELQIWDSAETTSVFSDIEQMAETCRFRDCTHVNEPGCAVRDAVESGLIDPKRLENFLKLRKEAEFLETKTTLRSRMEEKRAGKILAKTIKRFNKDNRKNVG